MNVGTAPPQWEKDLKHKWIELEDRFFKCTYNAFVVSSDEFSDLPVERRVRIFAATEINLRAFLVGKGKEDYITTYIEQDGYKVIGTPVGLEQWTEEYINDVKV